MQGRRNNTTHYTSRRKTMARNKTKDTSVPDNNGMTREEFMADVAANN
jgi:hypothetical protein